MNPPGTVGALLSRAFGALVALVLLSGIAGIAASLLQHQSLRRLSGHITPLRLANKDLRAVLSDAQVSLRGYLLTGDAAFLARYDEAAARFTPVAGRMRRFATDEREQAAIEQQVRGAERWLSHADQQRTVPPRSVQAARWAQTGRELSDPILTANVAVDARLAGEEREVRRRSALLRSATAGSQAVLTGLAVVLAAITAVRATRRITRPLDRLVTVLGQLGGGDHTARAPAGVDLAEISAVTAAVNALADEADRVREREAASARLTASARRLGTRIRQHLSVRAVLEEAVAGLGPALGADHVLARLAAEDGPLRDGAAWSRERSAGAGPIPTEQLSGLSPSWLLDTRGAGPDGERAYVWNDLEVTGCLLPAEERAALVAAGASAVLTVGFDGGTGPAGAVTLIRCAAGAGWSDEEARAAEAVTADLARGLLHAAQYEREQELVAQLRDLDNAKTDFMSTVSHELRTPLTSIAGYVEMLVDDAGGELAETQRRMLAVIERNTTRLRVLIEDLLVLSRIEAGALRTSRQDVEYGWLVATAVAAIEPAAVAAGVSIDTDVSGALVGRADPEQIDRVLMNLLSNAVKFTPRGGRVLVRASRDGDDVVVQVGDTGMGIPEAEQQHLFTRFFRASNATERAVPGTGLGLAIVRTIVAKHQGEVTVVSREGEGTTVTVRLPP